jgi:excisionase family DNA binding protein
MPAVEKLLTEADVAEILRVKRSAVRRLRRTGQLPCIKLGDNTMRFRPEDVKTLATPASR